MAVFKTAAFNHSATSPRLRLPTSPRLRRTSRLLRASPSSPLAIHEFQYKRSWLCHTKLRRNEGRYLHLPYFATRLVVAKGYFGVGGRLRRAYFAFNFLLKPFLKEAGRAIRSSEGAKYGGERGIRTLDPSFPRYSLSRGALSTTQPSLLNRILYFKIAHAPCVFID